ncbi:ABC transporter permease [Cryptosporangium phraense]|uniref:ABC transporter permease subunit n=1 Tax=Cryptosporangium phraense TaxID=2593070 RepID=A0A545AR54_9ACTN|nr:ABC transporter permease subunit [Cryptosporangium phraense]TQS43185.1 ABC transporter permease subunit [Cryptosporangium phraense]
MTRALRSSAYGALGMVVVLAVWQLLATTGTLGGALTAPTVVARVFGDAEERSTLAQAAVATGGEAVVGFGWSLLTAVVVGLLVTLVRPLRRGVDQLATIESAIPFLSLAPIMLALVSREHVPAAMAAATAFFPLYVAVTAGLDAVSRSVADLCTVLGASRIDTLIRARIPAGLPVIATGFKVGMPLAIVGAVIGEWFGSSDGVGPIMLAAMRGYQMPTMWAAVVATVLVALVLYGVCALLEALVTHRFG